MNAIVLKIGFTSNGRRLRTVWLLYALLGRYINHNIYYNRYYMPSVKFNIRVTSLMVL